MAINKRVTSRTSSTDFYSCQRLMKKYEAQLGRKPINGFKFTQFFKQWIQDNPFIYEDLKRTLLENWDSIENRIPEIRLKELQDIVELKGGKLHSSEYVTARTKVEVECEKGHVWEITPNNIKSGKWCPKCARKEKGSIGEIAAIVEKKGGKLHSTEYTNAHTKVEVECREGHVWKVSPNNLKRGKWCKKCATQKNNLKRRLKLVKEIKKMAEQRGGKIRDLTNYLSAEKVNSNAKVEVVCKEGHIWKVTPSNLNSGSWCPKCGDKEGKFKRTLKMNKEAQEIIRLRGGKLHSTEIVNAHTKLEVECKEGHVWKVTPNRIKSGTWCPECNLWRHERLCRLIFEEIFDKEFQKARPTWLLNDRENQMELDGYNQELQLAFEYQGQQHYKFVPYFQKSIKELEQRIIDDQRKKDLCKKYGITLIIIPYTIKDEEMLNYILKMCKEEFFNVPKNSEEINLGQLIDKSYLKEGKSVNSDDLQSRIDDYFFDG